jgi:hypothetical protein
LNHNLAAHLNASSAYRGQPQVCFLGEADMNWQVGLAGSVENDPEQTSLARQNTPGNRQ